MQAQLCPARTAQLSAVMGEQGQGNGQHERGVSDFDGGRVWVSFWGKSYQKLKPKS